MLTVYGRATSSNVQAVMWCIAELGLEVKRLDYGHVYGGLDTTEFGTMNPHRVVPVVVDGNGPPIWESAAIIRYLATQYGDETFWPRDPARRAEVDMWAEWSKLSLATSYTAPIFWPLVRRRASERDEVALAVAIQKMNGLIVRLNDRLNASPWIGGDHFSPADIMAGHVLYRYFTVPMERADAPAVTAYYARLQDRPAYREHVMVSYDPLRPKD